MEPRLGRRGNRPAVDVRDGGADRLQWSPGLVAGETQWNATGGERFGLLQWSPGLVAGETR